MTCRLIFVSTLVSLSLVLACAHTNEVKKQKYAVLKDEVVFEEEFPVVWKGIETALKDHKIAERDPDEVGPIELKQLKERQLRTDWIYGQSRDKYHEYRVNGSPRKKYLQTRFRFEVLAKRVIGGVQVKVNMDEEIEKLKDDGTPSGYSGVDQKDTSRQSELIEKIRTSILGAAP